MLSDTLHNPVIIEFPRELVSAEPCVSSVTQGGSASVHVTALNGSFSLRGELILRVPLGPELCAAMEHLSHIDVHLHWKELEEETPPEEPE